MRVHGPKIRAQLAPMMDTVIGHKAEVHDIGHVHYAEKGSFLGQLLAGKISNFGEEGGQFLFVVPGSGVKSAISGLKRFQSGGPGEYRFCESFYHRRRSESEHGTILWAGQFARNEEQFVA